MLTADDCGDSRPAAVTKSYWGCPLAQPQPAVTATEIPGVTRQWFASPTRKSGFTYSSRTSLGPTRNAVPALIVNAERGRAPAARSSGQRGGGGGGPGGGGGRSTSCSATQPAGPDPSSRATRSQSPVAVL